MTRTLFEIVVNLELDAELKGEVEYTKTADLLGGVLYDILATRESLLILFKGVVFDDAHLECKITQLKDTGVLSAMALLDIEAATAVQFRKPPLTKMLREKLLSLGKVKVEKRVVEAPPRAIVDKDVADAHSKSSIVMEPSCEGE